MQPFPGLSGKLDHTAPAGVKAVPGRDGQVRDPAVQVPGRE